MRGGHDGGGGQTYHTHEITEELRDRGEVQVK